MFVLKFPMKFFTKRHFPLNLIVASDFQSFYILQPLDLQLGVKSTQNAHGE